MRTLRLLRALCDDEKYTNISTHRTEEGEKKVETFSIFVDEIIFWISTTLLSDECDDEKMLLPRSTQIWWETLKNIPLETNIKTLNPSIIISTRWRQGKVCICLKQEWTVKWKFNRERKKMENLSFKLRL